MLSSVNISISFWEKNCLIIGGKLFIIWDPLKGKNYIQMIFGIMVWSLFTDLYEMTSAVGGFEIMQLIPSGTVIITFKSQSNKIWMHKTFKDEKTIQNRFWILQWSYFFGIWCDHVFKWKKGGKWLLVFRRHQCENQCWE